MIITGYGIIIFHLVEWIALILKSSIEVLRNGFVAFGLAYSAILSRHEVPIMLL